MSSRRESEGLCSASWLRRERLIGGFEAAWQQGERPAIDGYAPAGEPERTAVLVELVSAEFEFRRRAGEPVRAEEYWRRFPELAGDAELVQRLREMEQGPAAAPGGLLGKYQFLEVAGRGAFSVVYRARDTELGRDVAVKLPQPGRELSPEAEERFLREARSAARLRHPHIVALYDAGRAADTCYLVSEYVPGWTLAQCLAEGRPPLREAIVLLVQVAEAVHHAHQQGVIHRDLKPANVLLTQASQERQRPESSSVSDRGNSGRSRSRLADLVPKITDFGLARRTFGEATLTQEGAVLGTPAYMSPEQARGAAHRVDGRADVYSLGVILYEMLTGAMPFHGDARVVLRQVIEEPPRPPRQLADDVPADLDTVCGKCLEKEPQRRYPTAQALADDLRRFLEGRPVAARPVGAGGRLWRWCRRKPGLALLGSALLLVCVAGFAVVFWLWRSAETHLASAERRRVEAEENLQQALTIVRDLHGLSDRLDTLRDSGATPLRRETLAKVVAYYRTLIRRRPTDADTVHQLAYALTVLGQLQQTGALSRAALARTPAQSLSQSPPGFLPLVSEVPSLPGDGEGGSDREPPRTAAARKALASYREALPLWEKLAADHPDEVKFLGGIAECHHRVAGLAVDLGRTAEAGEARRQAAALLQALCRLDPAGADDRRLLAEYLVTLGQNNLVSERLEVCGLALRRAQVLAEPFTQEGAGTARDRRTLAETVRTLGLWHRLQGQGAQACSALERASLLYEPLTRQGPFGAEAGRLLLETLLTLRNEYRAQGRLQDAQHALTRAQLLAEQFHRAAGEQAPPLVRAECAFALATILRDSKQVAAGLEAARRATAAYEEASRSRPDDAAPRARTSMSLLLSGALHWDGGEHSEALACYERALPMLEQVCREQPDGAAYQGQLAEVWHHRGLALRSLGRCAEALAALQKGVALYRQVPDAEKRVDVRRRLADHYVHLARLQRELGHLADAVASGLEGRKLAWDHPRDLYRLASDLALCVAAVEKEPGSATGDAWRRYAEAAMATLREAFQAGYPNVQELQQDEDFRALRPTREFQDLLAELERRGDLSAKPGRREESPLLIGRPQGS